MALLDRHVAFMLSHQVRLTGRGAVIWGGKTLDATFDDQQAPVLDTTRATVIEGSRMLRLQASALPAAAKRYDVITVDGDRYEVQDILKQSDGLYVLVPIAPAT